MKKTILLGSLVIAMAACSSNESDLNSPADNSPAQFSASIEGQNKTRAFDARWESGDKIGITGTTGGKAYTNVAYETIAGNGHFTVVTDGQEIYYQDDKPVSFTAYYPWNELADGATTITTDTWHQSGQKDFDYLYAEATGSKGVPVRFTFAHRMAKLVLTVRCGGDITPDEVRAAVLSLEGFMHKGTFNVTDGTTATTGDIESEWQFANNTVFPVYNAPFTVDAEKKTVSYSLILFPQTFDEALPFHATLADKQTFTAHLDFTAANRNAGDETPGNEWKAGRQYNLSVTLHKTCITVEGCTITGWQEADGGNVDAN